MKDILTKISLTLNLLLVSILLFFTNKMGYLGRLLEVINANYPELPTDTLASQDWWQDEVKNQVSVTKNNQYTACLFGDSISSGLGNTLGDKTFNFALSGMSTISQIQQLKSLTAAQVRCERAIIALGTNDADYRITEHRFIKNMKEIIATVKQMGATRIVMVPAFYSTVAASHDPSMAGPIDRVEEIKALIRQVAESEKVTISEEGIQPLFEGKALKENLTVDGVHLNADGKKIYRQALLKILSQ